ncbi:BapA/Bap/LapF family large adhesin [Acinetobacter sp. F-1]|uniref:BapA/Bap/LapF family large adhesin n=1 Tax=Acinetobacter sp. F-1 TaxID=1796981 RepID=UPI001FD1850A|nr:BapA/Bap/LapF family large adhesin [Acinetobacter sp. F-1]
MAEGVTPLSKEDWLTSLKGTDGLSGSADLVKEITVLNDSNVNGEISSRELGDQNTVDLRIQLGTDAKAGDQLIVNGKEYTVTDVSLGYFDVLGVEVSTGFNAIQVNAQNTDKQTDFAVSFVEVVSGEYLGQFKVLNDVNNNQKLENNELDASNTISVQIDLGADLREGDVISINGIEKTLQSSDLQKGFIQFDTLPVVTGSNQIFDIQVKSADGILLDTASQQFDVLGQPRNIVESIEFTSDVNTDGMLNAQEMAGKYYTAIKVGLGADAKVGDIISVNGDRYVLNATEVQAESLQVFVPVREGTNPIKVSAVDEWSNIDSVDSEIQVATFIPQSPTSKPEIVDDVPLYVGQIKDNEVTNDSQPTIQGQNRVEGELITLIINGNEVVTTQPIVVGADGTWRYTPETALADGPYTISYTVTNSNGENPTQSPEIKFTIDTQLDSHAAKNEINQIEGKSSLVNDQMTFVVNQAALADEFITVSGQVLGVISGDVVGHVNVTITHNGVTRVVTVAEDQIQNGQWTADVSTAGLGLKHGDQATFVADALVQDAAGNQKNVIDQKTFTVDTEVWSAELNPQPMQRITGVEGADFKVDVSEVEDGYLTVTGIISALPTDVAIQDLTINLNVGNYVTPHQIVWADLTVQTNESNAKTWVYQDTQNGFDFTLVQDATGAYSWSLNTTVNKLGLSDGQAKVESTLVLKDSADNTQSLTAESDFDIALALTIPDLQKLDSSVGTAASIQYVQENTVIEIGNLGATNIGAQGLISNQPVMGMMALAEGEASSEVINVKSNAIGQIRAEFTNLSLLTVAKAYGIQLQKQDPITKQWELVMSAPLNGSGVIASLGTQHALGAVDNDNYVVTFNGLSEGQYRVVPYKSDSELTKAIEDIGLGALGDGALLGKDNQKVVLDLVSEALGEDSPSTQGLIEILEGVLTGVNILTTPVSLLLNTLLNLPLIKDVVGLVDLIVDKVVAQLVSNTLSLLNQTQLTAEFTSYFYENSVSVGNVLANDFDQDLTKLSLLDVTNAFGDVQTFAADQTEQSISLVGKHGVLIISQDGSYEYKLNPSVHQKDAEGNIIPIGKTDVFNYTATNGTLSHANTLTIEINGGEVTQLFAQDDAMNLTLVVDPHVESQTLASKSAFNVAYVGLGSVLDLGLIDPQNRFEINVAAETERHITFKAETGGVQILTDFDLYIYKYDALAKQYKLVDQEEAWFGAALLGGVSEELTKEFDAGQYIVLLQPSRGINALFGYTLETTRDLLLNYSKPLTIEGQAQGNVIADINQESQFDNGPNMEATFVISAKSLTLSGASLVEVHDDQNVLGTQIQGKYGNLTLFADGSYTYTANSTKNFNYGDIDRFEYTIYDAILDQTSTAQLDIQLNLYDVGSDIETVIAHMNIVTENVKLDLKKPQDFVTVDKVAATSFGVAGVGLGAVLDLNLIKAENAISLDVQAGKVVETTFSATGTSAVGIAAISDFVIYKLNEKTKQWELYHQQDQFLLVPLSVLGIPLGGIHNDPLTLALTEGEYKAFLTDRGLKVMGGATLKLDTAYGRDYIEPKSYEATAEGMLFDPAVDQLEVIKVNGADLPEDNTVVGEFGTLTVHANGTYTYAADNSLKQPKYGAIDTFTYVMKDKVTGLTSVSVINIKIGSVDAQADTTDINGDVSFTQAGMILREDKFVQKLVTFEDDAKVLGVAGKDLTIYEEFTIAPHSEHSENALVFSFDAKANTASVEASYRLVHLTYDEKGEKVEKVISSGSVTASQKQKLAHFEFELKDLAAGYYFLEMNIQPIAFVTTDYQYSLNGVQNYQDRWMTDSEYDYASADNIVKGNLLDNDLFSEGLMAQTILRVGNKVLYLDPNVGVQTIEVDGMYGRFVVDKQGNYTYTPNGNGGGREIMTYELMSPTGETDKSTIEINVAKIVNGSDQIEFVSSDAANDVYNMGQGSDTVIFDLLNQHDAVGGNGHDVWSDFTVGQVNTDVNADQIDISALLIGDPIQSLNDLAQYLSVEVKDGNTVISIDRDGTVDLQPVLDADGNETLQDVSPFQKQELLTLTNVQTTLEDLFNNNQIIY